MERVIIQVRPKEITIDDLEIIIKQCQDNSIKVSKKYVEVKYVEGVLLIIDKNNHAKAAAHAWNELNEIYFDTTKEVNWIGEGFDEIVEERYFKVNSYSLNELIEINDFSDETKQIVKEINDKLIE
jgi:hypothetical protein